MGIIVRASAGRLAIATVGASGAYGAYAVLQCVAIVSVVMLSDPARSRVSAAR